MGEQKATRLVTENSHGWPVGRNSARPNYRERSLWNFPTTEKIAVLWEFPYWVPGRSLVLTECSKTLQKFAKVVKLPTKIEKVTHSAHALFRYKQRNLDKSVIEDHVKNPAIARTFLGRSEKGPGNKYMMFVDFPAGRLILIVDVYKSEANVVTAYIKGKPD